MTNTMEILMSDDRITEKPCSLCKRVKKISRFPDLSDFYFHRSSGAFDSRCHDCRRAYQRGYKAGNKKKINQMSKDARQRKLAHYRRKNVEWSQRNPEKMREIRRRFYLRHKERLNAQAKLYREQNKEALKERRKQARVGVAA